MIPTNLTLYMDNGRYCKSEFLVVYFAGKHVRFNVSGNVTLLTISDLKEGATYSFTVSARTKIGPGQGIQSNIVIGPQSGMYNRNLRMK